MQEALKHPRAIDDEDGRGPARAARARSARRLQDQPAAVGQGPPRPERRARAVGRAEAGVRSRARDRSVRARGVLEPVRAARRTAAARVRSQAAQEGRRRASRSATRSSRRRSSRTSSAPTWIVVVGHDEGAQAQRAAAVHHEQAAADGALPGQEDDDAGAAALRRRHRDPRADRRAHHLHAHRLGARGRRGGRRRSASTSRPRSATTTCRRSRTSTRRNPTRRTRTRRSARPRCSTIPKRCGSTSRPISTRSTG